MGTILIDKLLQTVISRNASDLHITVGSPPEASRSICSCIRSLPSLRTAGKPERSSQSVKWRSCGQRRLKRMVTACRR